MSNIRTPVKAKLTATPASGTTPDKNTKVPKKNQLDLPINYTPKELELKQVTDLSPNKAGKALNHVTAPLSPHVNDKKNALRKPLSPVTFHTAGSLFKPLSPNRLTHNHGLVSQGQVTFENNNRNSDDKEINEQYARQIAYDEFLLIIKSSASFKNYVNFAAGTTQLQLFDSVKQKLKTIPLPHSKAWVSLDILITTQSKSATNTKAAESKEFNTKLEIASPKLDKIKGTHYAKPQAARTLIPEVMKIMVDSKPIREAIQQLYASRDAFDKKKHEAALKVNPAAVYMTADPALLFADITMKGEPLLGQPDKHICMLSLSGGEKNDANTLLLSVLRQQLENKKFAILGKTYEIVIASRYSDDFQSFLIRVLTEINTTASAKFAQEVKAFYSTLKLEEKKLFQECALPFFQAKIEANEDEKENNNATTAITEEQFLELINKKACIKQHTGMAAYKTCAEKPFMAEYAKALILSAIKNPLKKEHLVLEGVECIEFTFRRDGVEKFRSGKTQEETRKQRKSTYAGIEINPEIHNTYLKRPSDYLDYSMQWAETYECEHLMPCSMGCAINRPGFLTFISSLAEHMAKNRHNAKEKRVNQGLEHLTSPTRLSPPRVGKDAFQVESWLERTPLMNRLKQMIDEHSGGIKLNSAFDAAEDIDDAKSEQPAFTSLIPSM